MSDTMINVKIFRKCGGELEHGIKCIFVEPCSTEEYMNAMEDIISRKRIVSSKKDTYKEESVANQFVEAQINTSLSPKMRHEIIDVLCTYNNAFASDNEPLGARRGHEVDITLNIARPYPPVLRRQAYPASPRAREALETHTQELIQLGVLRKVGHNEGVEVKTPVIIACHNDKSRMVGNLEH
ncbi:hypothetical protein O181_083239 [Austropuccinia psidii MF-1]|uniref:Uncharacterized protein n=1 Tax=Austropuccinia psidii MF-1 TaxID=1389203 RepID=A0A9Q3FQT1_9BASI|nr:hypothetical protein [Austropuccinia psidii MF-1]